MRIASTIKMLRWTIVVAIIATSLTACIVESARYRPVYVEPVHARIVVHGHC